MAAKESQQDDPGSPGKRSRVRYSTQIEARLEAGGLFNTAQITNLSDTGLQLECNRRVLEELMPNIQRPDPRRPIQLRVHFGLNTEPARELRLDCRMLYVRRLAQDRFLTGGEFIDISEELSAELQDYLRRKLRHEHH